MLKAQLTQGPGASERAANAFGCHLAVAKDRRATLRSLRTLRGFPPTRLFVAKRSWTTVAPRTVSSGCPRARTADTSF